MRGPAVSTMFRQRPTNNPRIQGFAKALRRSSTPHERILWSILRDRRLADYKFRRQAPIGRYIADFVCYDAKLIVELDGSQHADDPTDAIRDAELEHRSFRILRIWNGDLLTQRDAVLDMIVAAVELAAPPSSGLRPPSPIEGEGDGTAVAGEQR
jgi:very-short-patch-repair endonuclease